LRQAERLVIDRLDVHCGKPLRDAAVEQVDAE